MASLTMEEYELMKDPKYRTYVSAVDKALKNFEYTSEWADLISALGKLNKVLLSHTKFLIIPRRIKISKRLAQCMHPALPSGVHLKALETYDIIFKSMGTNRLSQELFIYSAGLFPLLGHAAMNVRPSLLRVYESHFVPLGERLRPALSGFLSGVLLGLEEGSDHFDRTNSLLEKVCQEVGASYFYGCIWDCIASNSVIRFPAICFVLTHFNKKLSMEDQLYIMGTSIDIMVNALCMCMQDTSVLVQRSALDLLQVGFPLHNSPLVCSDMIKFITAALSTVLRRDMSLNRRLFAWLLGTEVNISLLNPEHPLAKESATSEPLKENLYFNLYSKNLLVQGIKIILNESTKDGHGSQYLKPYRLLVSLLDKPDIGPVILDDILYEVFRCLYVSYHKQEPVTKISFGSAPCKTSQELLKSANLFFTTLEPCYTWVYLGTLFLDACSIKCSSTSSNYLTVHPIGSGPPDLLEVCILAEFLLDIVLLETYVDATNEHLPKLFLHIITQLTHYCNVMSSKELTKSLQLCKKIMSRVHPPTVPRESKVTKKSEKCENTVSETHLEESKSTNSLSVPAYRLRANSDSSPRKKSSKSNTKQPSKTKKISSSKFNVKQLGLGKNYKTHSVSSSALPDLPNKFDKNLEENLGEI